MNAFYQILLNDYYILYMYNNMNKLNLGENQEAHEKENVNIFENTKKFLKLLIFLKNKYSHKKYTQIQLLANTINWLESYDGEISILLKMFSKLNIIVPDLYDSIKDVISNKEIKYGVYEPNSEYTKIVNEVFFLGMESILRVITSDLSIYKNLDDLAKMKTKNEDIIQDDD